MFSLGEGGGPPSGAGKSPDDYAEAFFPQRWEVWAQNRAGLPEGCIATDSGSPSDHSPEPHQLLLTVPAAQEVLGAKWGDTPALSHAMPQECCVWLFRAPGRLDRLLFLWFSFFLLRPGFWMSSSCSLSPATTFVSSWGLYPAQRFSGWIGSLLRNQSWA